MARQRENRSMCVVENNTTLPGNNISLELLGAISKDDVKQVEDYISPVDLRRSYSVLCISCKMGSLNIVKSLANKNPDLCLKGDNVGRIPLHIAITEGKAEVVKELVLACPNSLDYVTPNGETVIHFALNNSNDDSCLNILQQEIHRLDKHYLLEDLNPANATSNASFEIEPSTNSLQEVRIAVPASNEATNTSPTQQQSSMLGGFLLPWVASRRLLVSHGYDLYICVKHDIDLGSDLLGERAWSFGVRALSLLVLSSLFISYMMMLKTLDPNFVVITASAQIFTAFQMLCFYTLIVIILLMAVALMVRLLWTFRHRLSSN